MCLISQGQLFLYDSYVNIETNYHSIIICLISHCYKQNENDDIYSTCLNNKQPQFQCEPLVYVAYIVGIKEPMRCHIMIYFNVALLMFFPIIIQEMC